MTELQKRHIIARVSLVTAFTILEETLREQLSSASLDRLLPKGQVDKVTSRYIENKSSQAIKSAQLCLRTIEKKMMVPERSDEASEEIYENYYLLQGIMWLNREQKDEVADLIRKFRGQVG